MSAPCRRASSAGFRGRLTHLGNCSSITLMPSGTGMPNFLAGASSLASRHRLNKWVPASARTLSMRSTLCLRRPATTSWKSCSGSHSSKDLPAVRAMATQNTTALTERYRAPTRSSRRENDAFAVLAAVEQLYTHPSKLAHLTRISHFNSFT